jgi:hypothetical protein
MFIPKDDFQLQLYNWPENTDSLNNLNPKEVLAEFFEHYHFDDILPLMWEVFKALAENDRLNTTSLSKHHVHFYEWLCDTLVASYLIAKEYHLEKLSKTNQA